MTLFDTASELLVRLEAASAEDAGDELLARGRTGARRRHVDG